MMMPVPLYNITSEGLGSNVQNVVGAQVESGVRLFWGRVEGGNKRAGCNTSKHFCPRYVGKQKRHPLIGSLHDDNKQCADVPAEKTTHLLVTFRFTKGLANSFTKH